MGLQWKRTPILRLTPEHSAFTAVIFQRPALNTATDSFAVGKQTEKHIYIFTASADQF